MKLFTKVALVVLSSAVLTFVFVTVLLYFSLNTIVHTYVINGERALGQQIMEQIDRTLFSYLSDIQNIADSTRLKRFLIDDASITTIDPYINELLLLTGPWETLFIADMNGKIHYSTDKDEIEEFIYEEPQSTIAFNLSKEGGVYYSDLIISDDTGEYFVLFSAPIVNQEAQDNQIIGVVLGYIDLSELDKSISTREYEKEVYLYTSNGQLVATNKSDKSGLFLVDESLRADLNGSIAEESDEEPSNLLTTHVRSTGYASYEGLNWAVVTRVSAQEAFAKAEESVKNILLLLTPVMLLMSVPPLVLLRKYFIKPVTIISSLVEKIAEGDLTERLSFESYDELGDLARSFNKMAGALQKSKEGMEEKVTERTMVLIEQVEETEKSKLAIMNLLEDIEEEKEKVEQTVKERTHELQTEKARLIASINSLSFGFVIADLQDKIIVKNVALMNILDLKEEPESLANIINSFKGATSGLDALSHTCHECIELKQAIEMKEITYNKKFLRVFCTPVIVKNDTTTETSETVIGYVVLIEDITEQKVMERSRDEFFAVASHELRTPLTAIRGNADMILDMYSDKIVDNDMKEMLKDIDVSSIRLIAVVNDFLETSRLEQGRFELKKESFNIADIVDKVMRDMKSMVEQKGLTLKYIAPPEPLPPVFADKNRTEQVLFNLVGNAVKFTKEGSITISTSVLGNFVTVHVTDTGVGISEQNQILLFRKFQQAGEKMLARDVTQSTGLGLYISRMIIGAMGGTIGLEKSELDKGSTFAFTLPIAEVK